MERENFNPGLLYLEDYNIEHNATISSWANQQEQDFLELKENWQGTHNELQRVSDRCPTRDFVDKIVCYEGEMAGAFTATISSKEIVLTTLIVNPEFRGLGIAELTTQELIKNYKEIFDTAQDINMVKTNVKFGNEKAKRMFEKIGFKFQDLPGCKMYSGKYKILKQEQRLAEEVAQ